MDGRLKRVTSLCVALDKSCILIGTDGGNIYHSILSQFKINEDIIYQDVIMNKAPKDLKVRT